MSWLDYQLLKLKTPIFFSALWIYFWLYPDNPFLLKVTHRAVHLIKVLGYLSSLVLFQSYECAHLSMIYSINFLFHLELLSLIYVYQSQGVRANYMLISLMKVCLSFISSLITIKFFTKVKLFTILIRWFNLLMVAVTFMRLNEFKV